MPLPRSDFFEALVAAKGSSPAIVGPGQDAVTTYADLLKHAAVIQGALHGIRAEDRVGILVEKGVSYPAAFLGIWAAGGVAVPLCLEHPLTEMLYTIEDSDSRVLIVSKAYAARAAELKEKTGRLRVVPIEPLLSQSPKEGERATELGTESLNPDHGALFIYTSGTTGKPKGAVHTHRSTVAQAASLREAWHYAPEDRLLHVLPLHHIHGIVNALLTPLFSGSCVELAPEKFDAKGVWRRLLSDNQPITLFMAVPTIYTKLLAALPEGDAHLKHVRLCVSGSAALPTSVKEKWRTSTGHVLLERYGMTEVGMALSCGMAEEDRLDSSVGWPLPGIRAKLVDQDTQQEVHEFDKAGEIWVAGDQLFREYHNRLEQTLKEIVNENGTRWFKTGDVAIRSKAHKGAYYIQGRSSVDIIKSGGYKISALEVERDILQLPFVKEAAVLGVEDEEWGQRVACLLTPSADRQDITLKELRDILKKDMASYKVPSLLKIMKDGIPRNAMGKVNKKSLLSEFDHSEKKKSKL